jgi:hypothetical protein
MSCFVIFVAVGYSLPTANPTATLSEHRYTANPISFGERSLQPSIKTTVDGMTVVWMIACFEIASDTLLSGDGRCQRCHLL